MRFLIVFISAIIGVGFSCSSWAQAPGNLTQVNDFAVVQLDSPMLAARPGGDITITLEGWGDQFRLVLRDNERLLDQLPKPRQKAIGARGDRFLSGALEGKPGSWARMNWINGQFNGAFYDGNQLYVVDSPKGFAMPKGRSVDPTKTLLMRFSDLELDALYDHGGLDSGQASPPIQNYNEYVAQLRKMVPTAGLAALNMPVTIVTDTEFEDDLGVDTRSIAIGRVNFVDGIFSGQLGVGIALWHYEQLSDNGPLTSTDSGVLLSDQFRGFMTSGDGSDIPFRGLAHLFSGKNFDGSTVGRAYVNVLCSTWAGYGINQNLSSNTTSSLVFAHELGHNFAANHVDEGIMQARISSSQEFSQESVDVMSAAAGRANCLVDSGEPMFKDGFE